MVALRAEDMDWARGLIQQEHPAKPVRVVEGGDSRQQSVENALATLAPDTDLVAVHDAVRPFIDSELVEKVIAEAAQDRRGDCRHRAGGHRQAGAQEQDPRDAFRASTWCWRRRRRCSASSCSSARSTRPAKTASPAPTNPAWWSAWKKSKCSVVQGSDRNIKITKPTDMELARLFLSEEVDGETAS